ncbi:hypothetical protein [Paracoccus lutimaris]|uniref:Autotransporter domain-containing protein n=1 Tax=Paracoccus lutimaris TaxID=1490030 RepID=A0A368Z3L9_9RHOB|nr:hypothetical protein [Paracoccus lutimaris]RCW87053.1 hypothetical protein DFP89_10357 [Paracoccus lutimaris]
MFPINKNSISLICRAHLLLTTALISVAPLAFGGGMVRAQMYLDNGDTPGGSTYETVSGSWSNGSQIWNDGSGAGAQNDTLPPDEIGVLTSQGGSSITLTLNGNISAGGLRLDSGDYLLTGGTLRAGNLGGGSSAILSFAVADGSILTIASNVEADVNTGRIDILETGAGTGQVRFTGDTQGQMVNASTARHSGQHTGDLQNDGTFQLTGDIDGDLTNSGSFTLAGNVEGLITNSGLIATGLTGGTADNLTNLADSTVVVGEGQTLTVDNEIQNSGTIQLNATGTGFGTLDADVNNLTGSILRLGNGGRVEGSLVNAGQIGGTGTITGSLNNLNSAAIAGSIGGAVTNDGTLTTVGNLSVLSATNGGTLNVGAGHELNSGSAMVNNGVINLAGDLLDGVTNNAGSTINMTTAGSGIDGSVTNAGTMNIMGAIEGQLYNRGVVTTAGDVEVDSLYVAAAGSTTIGAGHELTTTQLAQNFGTTTVSGTLNGSIHNSTLGGVIGRLDLTGGAINGNVDNDGVMNGRGSVSGLVDNSGTLNTTGTLSVGSLINSGTTVVQSGNQLNSAGSILNSNQMTVNGTVSVATGSQLTNSSTGTLTLAGAQILGSITNDGDMDVNSNSRVQGNLTNNANLSLNSTGGADVTLTVDNIFVNRGTVDGTGTGDLTIVTNLYDNDGGTVANVNVIGDLLNRSTLTYSEDSFINGGLRNAQTGSVTVSAGLDMTDHNVVNQGNFLVTTDADSTGNLHNVVELTNSGNFTIDTNASVEAGSAENAAPGTMTIAGTLDSNLLNRGQVDMDGGVVDGQLTNNGELNGTGTVIGGLVNNGTSTMTGEVRNRLTNEGTVILNGELQVGELHNNEQFSIGASGILQSTTTAQNAGSLTVAGRLEANLRNTGTTTLVAGSTILGNVNNTEDGGLNGRGTISGALANAGTAQIGGHVTGQVTNTGSLTSVGPLRVGGLTNEQTLIVGTSSTLTSDTAVLNEGAASIHGTLVAALNNTGTTTLANGRVTGAVTNTQNGLLDGTGQISGTLANAGTAEFGGRVTGQVTNTGRLTSVGTLRVGGLTNSATLTVAEDSTLQSDSAVQNNQLTTIAGRLQGDLNNAGTTTMSGGSVTGTLINTNQLSGDGTIETLDNRGTAAMSGRVDTLANTGTLSSRGRLSVGSLTNDELVRVTAGSTLSMDNALLNRDRLIVAGTIEGRLDNRSSTVMVGGTIDGSVDNAASGTFSGSGRVDGTLTNAGTLTADGDLSVGRLINNATVDVLEDGELSSDTAVRNNAALRVAGTLAADLLNGAAGTTTLANGTIDGNVSNIGSLTGTGTITGQLANSGVARIAGEVTDLLNLSGGRLTTSDDLAATSFSNAGQAVIAANTELTVTNPVQNVSGGVLQINGSLLGSLANAGTLNGAGEISQTVSNGGIANWRGRIGGSFGNSGTANLGGSIAGGLENADGGVVTTVGDLSVSGESGVTNRSGGRFVVADDTTLAVTHALTNERGGHLTVAGELQGSVTNAGTIVQTGLLTGTLTTTGSASLNGLITGNLNYDGGSLLTGDNFRVGGDFRLGHDYTIEAGRQINAARTVVTAGSTLDLNGALVGALLNNGRVEVRGDDASVSGLVTNNRVVSLSNGAGQANVGTDVLTVGGLAGGGSYYLDVDTRNATADQIVVSGGAATGTYRLELNFIDPSTVLSTNNRLMLIDVDESFGDQNTYDITHSDLPAISERISYSIDRASGNGDATLVAQTNPAIGALFGNVALTQSLIGSVINRPTSPFVTALAYEDKDKPCGVGSWGRITGGHATATGSTDNGVSSVESEITADYYGMQVGTDLACFDDRFGGWDMALGVLGGINRGDTNQPVYAIDPNNSQNVTGTLTSYTSTDFEQRYVGVYMTANRGRLQADLQYRLEKTDFTIENKGVGNYQGLGLDETDFSSDGYTLSGSLSYGIPVGESGWAVVPTVGFAWSKMSTDSIPFGGTGTDAGYRLSFDDSTRKIGFVGATVAKTFVQPSQNAALSTFATATWYKDFADPTISVFSNDNDSSFTPQKLESDNLGAYGEISIGANWIKVLGPKSRGRQISAGARIDARFGDQLDSIGVSGQFRWQF